MTKEKKPSIYSDRGNIGSAEDLDEYGVWVKSEPQVISSGAGVQKSDDFDDSMFNTEGFSNDGSSSVEDIDFPGDLAGDESLETDFEDFTISDDADGIASSSLSDNDYDVPTVRSIENNIENIQDDFDNAVRGKEDGNLSTQLLKKIANELSSIRGELHDLKKEFSIVRSGEKDGFFSEEDDETIALTGDEMDNILSTSDDAANKDAEVKTMANILGEDDDETIALTGDEMDNILNTADFTEETGTEETSEDDLGEYDDETIALTGDEMDNILNTADFTEETGTEESTDNSLSADLNDVDLDMSAEDTTESDSSLSGLDLEDFSESAAPAEDDISAESDAPAEDDLVIDDFDISALGGDSTESDAFEESAAPAEDDVSLGSDAPAEDDLVIDDFDMSALGDESTESAVSEESALSEESAAFEESEPSAEDDLAIDDFDMSALGGDSTESAASEEDAVSAESDAPAEDDLAMDDLDMSALDGDSTENDGQAEDDITIESDIGDDDVISLDDSDDLGSELSMDDLDMSALDDDSEEIAVSTEEDAGDEGETKQEYIDNDIADLGVNLDSESLDSESLDAGSLDIGSTDLSTDAFDESGEIDIDASKDSEELEELRNKGATPVTFPPENISYLEEDDHLNLDLSEAVIDEPELSTEGIDEPLTEPSLDIDSFDDLSISGSEDASDTPSFDESSIDDLDIDIDMPLDEAKEDSHDLTLDDEDLSIDEHIIPEGFEAEIQETPVPFDEDIEEDITIDDALEASDLSEEEPSVIPAGKPVVTTKAAPAKQAEPVVDEIEDIGEIDDIGDDIADIDEKPVKAASAPAAAASSTTVQRGGGFQLPSDLKRELKNILSYMDQLLESLPEEKIEEFAKSEYFDSYKKLFKELGLV